MYIISDNIYWTDQGFGTIQVSRTDGRFRYVLISSDLEKPRSIVVHPSKGLLFWTDGGIEQRPGSSQKQRIDGIRYSPRRRFVGRSSAFSISKNKKENDEECTDGKKEQMTIIL